MVPCAPGLLIVREKPGLMVELYWLKSGGRTDVDCSAEEARILAVGRVVDGALRAGIAHRQRKAGVDGGIVLAEVGRQDRCRLLRRRGADPGRWSCSRWCPARRDCSSSEKSRG